jgi:hypothetical protein
MRFAQLKGAVGLTRRVCARDEGLSCNRDRLHLEASATQLP